MAGDNFEVALKLDTHGISRPLGRITGDFKKFDSAIEASNARVIAFGASVAIIGSVTKAFKDLAQATITVEKNFADINRILNLNNAQFERFGKNLFDISRKTSTSFQDVSDAALEFARQGLSVNETLKRTSDALTLVRLTGINAKKAVDSLTATVNSFESQSIDTTTALNKFVAVETKFAVSARDLVEGLSRVGSSAVDAKVQFDQLNAIVASVQQTTGRGGAVIGNALKTIFTRLQRSSTLNALESFNIAVKDIEGNTLPAITILQNLSDEYGNLSNANQAYLREQVAGVFQANILSAILKDLDKDQQIYSQALDVSAKASNESAVANEKLNQTLSALLAQTGTSITELQQNIGKLTFEPLARNIIEPFKDVVDFLNDISGNKAFENFFKGITNLLQGPGLGAVFALLLKLTINLGKELKEVIPSMIGINAEKQKQVVLQEALLELVRKEERLLGVVQSKHLTIEQKVQQITGAILKENQALEAQRAIMTDISALAKSKILFNPKTNQFEARNKKGRRAAEGFIPDLIKAESKDISMGVGGAPSTAQPMIIPNFSLGNGKKTTVVANTSETFIPNFGGTGASAIFTKDMMKSIKGFSAAEGFSPKNPSFIQPSDFGSLSGKNIDRKLKILSNEVNNNIRKFQQLGGSAHDLNLANQRSLAKIKRLGDAREKIARTLVEHTSVVMEQTKLQKNDISVSKSAKTKSKGGRLSRLGGSLKGGVDRFGVPLALATSFGAGILEDQFGEAGGTISAVTSGAATGALFGAGFGVPGILGGAALGGLGGLGMSSLGDETDKLAEKFRELSEETNRNILNSKDFIAAKQAEINATDGKQFRDAIQAQEKALRNITNISDKTALMNADTVDKMNKVVSGIEERERKRESLSFAELSLSKFSVFGGSFVKGKPISGLGLSSLPNQSAIQAATSKKILSSEDIQKNLIQFTPAFQALKQAGVTPGTLEFNRVTEGGLLPGLERIAQDLPEISGIVALFKNISEQLGGSQIFGKEFQKAFESIILKQKAEEEKAKEAKDRGIVRVNIKQELNRAVSDQNRIIQSSLLKNQVKVASDTAALNSQFLNPEELARSSGNIQIANIKNKRSVLSQQFGNQNINSIRSAFEKVSATANLDVELAGQEALRNFQKGDIESSLNVLRNVGQISELGGKPVEQEAFQTIINDLQNSFLLQKENLSTEEKLARIRMQSEILRAENSIVDKDVVNEANKNISKMEMLQANQQSLLVKEKALIQAKLNSPGFGLGLTLGEQQRKRINLQRQSLDLDIKSLRSGLGSDISKINRRTAEDISSLLPEGMDSNLRRSVITNLSKTGSLPSGFKANDAIRDKIELANLEKQALEQSVKLREDELKIQQQIVENQEKLALKLRTTFTGGLSLGFQRIREDSDTVFSRLGEDLPIRLRDGLTDAFSVALDGTESLGDAMKGVAVDFLRTIRTAFIQNAVSQVIQPLGGLFPSANKKQLGGLITAQNGTFIPGNRTGDRNLAMLEDGEYVLNRNAVQALGGPGALNDLNFKQFPRFAKGGSAQINQAIDSKRMSGFFLAGNNPELQELREKQRAALNKPKDGNNLLQMFISTLAAAAASSALGSLGSKSSSVNTADGITNSSTGEMLPNPNLAQEGGMIQRFQSGGSSSPVVSGGNKNDISININMGGGSSGGNASVTNKSGASDDATEAKEFARKIESAVVKVIEQEQRVGGRLSPTRRKA